MATNSRSGDDLCMTQPASNVLNQACHCTVVELAQLRAGIQDRIGRPSILEDVQYEHLFSSSAVFLDQVDLDRMTAICRAVYDAAQSEVYVSSVLQWAPDIALSGPAHEGVLGLDFHLSSAGPRLIEINTNPGGLLLNAYALESARACCFTTSTRDSLDQIISKTLDGWLSGAGHSQPVQHAALVDDSPQAQFLYPEFLLYRQAFAARGLECAIADPRELVWDGAQLLINDAPLDFVYNRLTDFDLSQPGSAALRAAVAAGVLHVSPHPRGHALYADKRNLSILSDPYALEALGLPASTVDTLHRSVPRTWRVEASNLEELWKRRNALFFKPATGYGSRGSYKGSKLTKRVWDEIASSTYVAQELIPPSVRALSAGSSLKVDVRAYCIQGTPILFAARLYQGQTTNMRTAGGGFAPVLLAQHTQ